MGRKYCVRTLTSHKDTHAAFLLRSQSNLCMENKNNKLISNARQNHWFLQRIISSNKFT